MDKYELAQALTDVSDDLLMEAESAVARRRMAGPRMIAAVAAIVLTITACAAVTTGITWHKEQVELDSAGLWLEYYGEYDESLTFDHLELTVPLEQVKLKQDRLEKLEKLLADHWSGTQLSYYKASSIVWENLKDHKDTADADALLMEYQEVHGDHGYCLTGVETLEEAEELLGISLNVSAEVRSALEASAKFDEFEGIRIQVLTGLTVAEMEVLLEAGQTPEPVRVVLDFDLVSYCGNGDVEGTIVIPLTRENAEAGYQIEHNSYYEKEGPIWQETAAYGGREVTLFGNDPQEGYAGWAEAIYTVDGIAYIVNAYKYHLEYPKPTYDSAKGMLLPLVENLK